MDALTETLLVFAARRDHLVQQIEPALARGATVLCDRFTDASFAYQGGGRGFDRSVLTQLEAWVQQGRQPDLTLWLDLPAATAAERRAAVRAPDRFETQDLAFFERVSGRLPARCAADPGRFARIDARAPVDAVWQQIEPRWSGGMVVKALVVGESWRAAPALAGRPAGPCAGRAARPCDLAARSPGVGALEFALVLGHGLVVRGVCASRALCGTLRPLRQLPPGAVARASRLAGADARALRREKNWPLIDDKAEGDEASASPAARSDRRDPQPGGLGLQDLRARARQGGGAAPGRGAERARGQRPAQDAGRTPGRHTAAADAGRPQPAAAHRAQPLPEPGAAGAGRMRGLRLAGRAGRAGAEVLLAACSGRPLDALALSQAGVTAEVWSALPQAVARGQVAAFAGWPMPLVLDALHKLCHDAMARAAGAPTRFFAPTVYRPAPTCAS
jgi:hypothetical protein